MILVLVALLTAFPVHADIDQHCLSVCINAGQGETVCLPQCSYNLKPKPAITAATPPAAPDDTNGRARDLEALRPAGEPAPSSVPASVASPVTARVDRICLAACLQKSFAYDLCNEHCTRQDCIGNSCQDSPAMSPDTGKSTRLDH